MVKVISLSNEAYLRLSEKKEVNESFSDVVLKLTEKKGDILSVFGCAREDKKFIEGLKKSYKERDKNELRVY